MTAPVRLVGGATYGEGRVDVYDDVTRQWLPVCAAGWTQQDADVTCRQAGFRAGALAGRPAQAFIRDLKLRL